MQKMVDYLQWHIEIMRMYISSNFKLMGNLKKLMPE